MKTEKAALILYITSSILAVIATIFDFKLLILIMRPIVIPAIFLYYLSIKKQRVNLSFIVVLLLNFIGDLIVTFKFHDSTVNIMGPYFISYLIMLKFAIGDIRKIQFNKSGLALSVFVFSLLMYLMYTLILLFIDVNEKLVVPVIVYGIVLAVYGSIATYSYYCKNSTVTFYLLMIALSSTVSDVFYVMFDLIFRFPGLYYFEFAIQLISYFFITQYFVTRESQEEVLVII